MEQNRFIGSCISQLIGLACDESFAWVGKISRQLLHWITQFFPECPTIIYKSNSSDLVEIQSLLVRYHLRNRQNLLMQKCQSYFLYPSISISCFLNFPSARNSINFREDSFANFSMILLNVSIIRNHISWQPPSYLFLSHLIDFYITMVLTFVIDWVERVTFKYLV